MNKKEVIERLNLMQERCCNGYDAEAIYLAIKALEERPITNDDTISRSALKEAFECLIYNDFDDMERTQRLIDNAPPVVNEYTKGSADGERSGRHLPLTNREKAVLMRQLRPHGEWIIDGHHYKCSRCGKTLAIMFSETDDDLIGCPFCLADMRVKDELRGLHNVDPAD